MCPCTRSTPKFGATSAAGFTAIELLLGVLLMGLAIAATSGMFLASKEHMRMQAREIETTLAARSAIDMIVRDLRLGGACLPVTGDFISLDGIDDSEEDEIITRTGLTRPDLSCVLSTSNVTTPQSGSSVTVDNTEGFAAGMRAYIRSPNGTGEYFDITSVISPTELGRDQTFAQTYAPASGVYAIDERRFYINWFPSARGMLPELMVKVGSADPQSFAVGIEKLNIQYQLRENCPPCDVVDMPVDNAEWSTVEKVVVSVTARSELPDREGEYYRRTMSVGVKPRNLLPQ